VIPRVFHRIFLDEPVPERFEGYWRRLHQLHPRWKFRTWGRTEDLLPLLKNRALFESLSEGRASYGFRSDIARYELLAAFGGVYVDTDIEPLRRFDPLLEDGRPFIAWCSDKELDPSVIGSPAGHPAIRQLVDELAQVREWCLQGNPMTPPGTTGPTYVTARWRWRDDVRRLPPVTFFPYHWSRMQDDHPPWPERSYAIHHWSAGWKDPTSSIA